MGGKQKLMASLLYGTGMRLMDCVRLRVQDVDFEYQQIVVRDGKGKKDRVVPLPERLADALKTHLDSSKWGLVNGVRVKLNKKNMTAGTGYLRGNSTKFCLLLP